MAKIPYLIRRKNVFYFRLGVPTELREAVKSREIIQSLKTQNSEEAALKALKLAAHFKTLLHDLKTGKVSELSRPELIASVSDTNAVESLRIAPAPVIQTSPPEPITKTQAPLLSVVVDDFLKRYDPTAKVMLGKLNATLPILVELIDNKPINQILQADLNHFFDDVQRLPVRRDAGQFKGLSIREVIAANNGPCIAEKTFKSTYRACVSVFLSTRASRQVHQSALCRFIPS